MSDQQRTVEVRCPVGPRKLFTKLKFGQETGRYIHPDNHIEFSCGDCSRAVSAREGQSLRVLHRYNFAGQLVVTLVEVREPSSAQR